MYDELVKTIRAEIKKWKFVDSVIGEKSDATKILSQAADAIEELSRLNAEIKKRKLKARMAKPRWIPVEERLPECEGERVLVASNFLTSYLRVSICYFSKNLEDVDKYDFDGEKRSGFYAHDAEYGYYERLCVRYWMPLPQPPKEGT